MKTFKTSLVWSFLAFAISSFAPAVSFAQISPQNMVGTWQASNCRNCFLQVSQNGPYLFGDMRPWNTSGSYSGGPQFMSLSGRDTLLYRNDQYRIQVTPPTYTAPGRLTLVRLTRNNPNVESATKNFGTPLPRPQPSCPPGTVWDPRLQRCVGTPPQPVCPPGTVWDPSIQRCVSIVTPPQRQWTCSIYQFRASSYDMNQARQAVLAQCGSSSGGYVCRGSDVRCTQ